MPKVKYCLPQPKVNYLAQVFRDYRRERCLTSVDIAEAVGTTPENARRNMNKPSKTWTVGQLMQYCDVIGIPYSVAFEAAAR